MLRLVLIDEEGNIHEVSDDAENYFRYETAETEEDMDDDDLSLVDDIQKIVHQIRGNS